MRLIPLALLLISALCAFAQQPMLQKDVSELSETEKQLLLSIPDLPVPELYQTKSIPYAVDNSQLMFFRPMFTQAGMSCGQASSTGICFTYEMNRARNLPANTNANLYPTHFVYNWVSGDWGSNGASYYHTLDLLNKVGTPNQEEYGGTIDAGGNLRWMTGYNLYFSAMHNRVKSYYAIRNMNTPTGIQTLKNWINDHLDGSEHGGCAIFYSSVPYPDASLPAGTEEAGKYVITTLSGGTAHSMAVLGYNDSIRYDYNGDGQYTNHIDLNSDGIIDARDWEIGGFKMCNTYSGGPNWANGGFSYITYKAIADGAFWSHTVHVMKVNPDYEPMLTVKSRITYTNRKRLKVVVGMATNLSATVPEYYLDFPIFDYQGGDRFMTGGTAEIDKTIEFGLDITPFTHLLVPGQEAKFFLKVTENDTEAWGVGHINYFSVIDYSTGSANETACSQTNVFINHNTTTMLSLVKTINHAPPQITNNALPSGAILANYSHQMTASGGTEPYTWSFDTDYQINESVTEFPTGGTSQSLSGYTQINLGFDFPFAGNQYSSIWVSANGMIVFQSGFSNTLPYNSDDEIIFLHARCIAPFFNTTITSTFKKLVAADYIVLMFENSVLDYAVKLYASGDIQFIYKENAMTAQQQYVTGVSNGTGVNVQRLLFSDQTSIANGFSYYLQARLAPAEFSISESGLLTGLPTVDYVSVDFHFKLVDNNNLISKKTIPFITDGLTMQFIPHTVNNDIPEYNETVDLEIIAQNPMSSPVTNINVSMQTADAYITITDAAASLPNLNPGQQTSLLNAMQFQIAPNVPDQHVAQFMFTVSSAQNTWNYQKTFTISAPKIQPGTHSVNDGGDNLLAAGETAAVSLNVHNNGHSPAGNIQISLSSLNEYVSIVSQPAVISALNQGSLVPVSFQVTVSPNVPQLQQAVIQMVIAADNGYTTTETFSLIIHTPVLAAGGLSVLDGDDGILSAGETSNVVIPVFNQGLIDATNLTIVLSTADEYVTINNNTYSTSLISAANSEFCTFNLSISPTAPFAHYVPFDLHITGDNGLDITLHASTVIGLLIETFESGDLSAFEWVSSGAAPWYLVTDVVYEGNYSLRSGSITHDESSVLSITVTVVADGLLSFAYKVSSENYYDFLEFMEDGQVVASWSGVVPWTVYNHQATAGDHTYAWRYRKDYTVSSNQDCAWIDNIVFPAINGNPPLLQLSNSEVFKVMYTDETDTDTLIMTNIGGGILDYSVSLEFPQSKALKNITGSTLTSSIESFMPGETYDVLFTVHNASPDQEWLKTIVIDFPEGFVVNSYTSFSGGSGGPLSCSSSIGEGVELTWTTENQWGTIYGNETATCTVNITINESFGSSAADIFYTLYGDIYGSEPHTLEGQITWVNLGDFWLVLNPVVGSIPFNTSADLYMHFNTDGLDNGYYYANIRITHSAGVSIVPVSLQIINVGIDNASPASGLHVYPNPFYDILHVDLDNSPVKSLALCDVQGRELWNWSAEHDSGNQIVIDAARLNLRPGMYLIKMQTENDIVYRKLTKIE